LFRVSFVFGLEKVSTNERPALPSPTRGRSRARSAGSLPLSGYTPGEGTRRDVRALAARNLLGPLNTHYRVINRATTALIHKVDSRLSCLNTSTSQPVNQVESRAKIKSKTIKKQLKKTGREPREHDPRAACLYGWKGPGGEGPPPKRAG
jgi:hypothetical protein